ncbi:hypothetical protein AGDE_08331 [Angomonas deanei]|uniref:Uncharacterized protein n=1 Tax=Angomonas deanei TaxID=59799 RepID=A0A7G2CDN4_9TRYP|nr:hypothetical protein AGDE_08331 [Angomonas deanei]CAD2217936.1 hypothetical protein, conserved [Angomonas deanei]|eukprot:EPY33143.1 hypothetical protein AGDE_08331 [Angomonas deanei]
MAAQNVCITKATLFLFHETTAEYESFGLVHCAVVGAFAEAPAYKLGCYRDSQDYICICDITSNNDLGVCLSLQGRYAYFRDSQKRKWSLEFSDVTKAEEFCANVVVAMYGVSNQLSNCLVSCDVGSSGSGKRVSQGDKVTCTYTSWVVQRGGERSVPKLGSLLESKVEVTIPSVPANHFCVTSAMLGFEGSIIGMEEGGQRFVIIPSGCMQGSGPKVNTCYFLSVIRREAETPSARSLVKPTEPTTVSTGFSREQFLFVDRLRDQVFTLTEKLRETRRQLDSFSEGVNAYADQASPKGIRSAQVEYSLKKVMDETVETVDAIAVRRSTLSVMRERNESLQAQLAKLMDTRKNLSSEVVHTQNNQKRRTCASRPKNVKPTRPPFGLIGRAG